MESFPTDSVQITHRACFGSEFRIGTQKLRLRLEPSTLRRTPDASPDADTRGLILGDLCTWRNSIELQFLWKMIPWRVTHSIEASLAL